MWLLDHHQCFNCRVLLINICSQAINEWMTRSTGHQTLSGQVSESRAGSHTIMSPLVRVPSGITSYHLRPHWLHERQSICLFSFTGSSVFQESVRINRKSERCNCVARLKGVTPCEQLLTREYKTRTDVKPYGGDGPQILNRHRFQTLPAYILPINEVNLLFEQAVSVWNRWPFNICRRRPRSIDTIRNRQHCRRRRSARVYRTVHIDTSLNRKTNNVAILM